MGKEDMPVGEPEGGAASRGHARIACPGRACGGILRRRRRGQSEETGRNCVEEAFWKEREEKFSGWSAIDSECGNVAVGCSTTKEMNEAD
jgi:hypothetical protein